MATQSEIERNKAVAHAFYQAGIEGRLTTFAQYLEPDFAVTAPNYLPWGGTHKGAAFFSGDILPNLPEVFDFSRFSYESVTAEDDRVAAIINMGVTGTDRVIRSSICGPFGTAKSCHSGSPILNRRRCSTSSGLPTGSRSDDNRGLLSRPAMRAR